MYAIVDIETTGGSAAAHGITEIAILLHDGNTVEGKFVSLINPGVFIPAHITALTGISNSMVASAPSFAQVADQIYNLLHDRVFVAHNVNFDYSFLFHALQDNGYALTARKLCTVRYARKVVPGLPRYGLGSLTRYFSIQNNARHRAAGDAEATAALFDILRSIDTGHQHLRTMLHGRNSHMYLPTHLDSAQLDRLPYLPGIYYFKSETGQVLYVGKAKNLRRRVAQHFSNNTPGQRKQDMLTSIYQIDYTVCANETHASVLEELEIKRLWPRFNRSQKRPEFHYGLYTITDQRGLKRAVLNRHKHTLPALAVFKSVGEGYRVGRQLASRFNINPDWFFATAQVNLPEDTVLQHHNAAMHQLETEINTQFPSFVLVHQGKTEQADDLFALYWVEHGEAKGNIISATRPENYASAVQQICIHKPNAFVTHLLLAEALAQPELLLLPEN